MGNNPSAGGASGSVETKTDWDAPPSVMISYAKTGSADKAFVRNLHDALLGVAGNIWVEWEDIPLNADWLSAVHKGIEQSDVFIFVLSPASVKSETCHFELTHAVKCGKRLVPVVFQDVDYREVSKEVASKNWIFFRTGSDDFEAAMKLLLKQINEDLVHLHGHTHILQRAVAWEESEFDKMLLLKGKDAQDSLQWLYRCSIGTAPFATPLIVSYVCASNKLPMPMKRSLPRTASNPATATSRESVSYPAPPPEASDSTS